MKILVSACLMGEDVRYDGNNSSSSIKSIKLFSKIIKNCEVFSICPEVAGGLEIPRQAAEIKDGLVVTKDRIDVTPEFSFGAKETLTLCKQENIEIALLKAKSPSCGNNRVYDGSFSNHLIENSGVTAKLLMENGIKVFNETQLEELELLIN